MSGWMTDIRQGSPPQLLCVGRLKVAMAFGPCLLKPIV